LALPTNAEAFTLARIQATVGLRARLEGARRAVPVDEFSQVRSGPKWDFEKEGGGVLGQDKHSVLWRPVIFGARPDKFFFFFIKQIIQIAFCACVEFLTAFLRGCGCGSPVFQKAMAFRAEHYGAAGYEPYGAISNVAPGAFYLASVNDKHHRAYARQPLP
jgi:hypothetical protein